MAPMLPFVVPIVASGVGAAVTGLMNKGANKMAPMPKITPPPVGDQDKTPGDIAKISMGSAASQNVLSNSNTVGGHLLGG